MKPETRTAITNLDVEKQQELVALLAELMTDEEFIAALHKENGDPTTDGNAIISALVDMDDVRDDIMGEFLEDADRIHEAICEGRKQDAIDLLNQMIPEANLRPAAVQNSLFPDRVLGGQLKEIF